MILKKLILVSFILFSSILSSQTLLYEVSINDQLNNAELVIEGKVIEKKSYRSSINDKIYTLNKVHVYRSFKGGLDIGEYINIVTRGGSIGYEREIVRPSLELNNNDLGVFILKSNTNVFDSYNEQESVFYPEAGMQGFYKYDSLLNSVSNPFTTYNGIQTTFYSMLENATGQNNLMSNTDLQLNTTIRSARDIEVVSFSPDEIRAGNDEVLVISGSGFGDSIGSISFRNSDNGGATFQQAFDSAILSWSDTSIRILVPSFAGTGEVQIVSSDGESIITNNELTVLSSELNISFDNIPDESFRAKLFNSDGNGGYTWVYNEDFVNVLGAPDAFERAINTWVCETNISWLISDELSTDTGSSADGVNLVSFISGIEDPNNEISIGMLAVTTTFYRACVNGSSITSYVAEVDMIFNSDFRWFYDEDGSPSLFENDFQGTATHELGHAHGLGHVIAPTKLMHFETSSGEESATRDVDEDSRIGVLINYEFSKTGNLCGLRVVNDRDCLDTTTLGGLTNENEEVESEPEIIVDDEGNINVRNSLTLSFFGAFDLTGRNVATSRDLQNLNISNLSNGFYIIVAEQENGDRIVRKIVK